MWNLSWFKRTFVLLVLWLLIPAALSAQTFETLLDFNGADGSTPLFMQFVQGVDGDLYGTTSFGGTNDGGTVIKASPDHGVTVVYSFCNNACTDGAEPGAGLLLATDGNFYGTTQGGGQFDSCEGFACGTVFRITPDGILTTLHSFDVTDGTIPYGKLTEGIDGNLYGTTSSGGAHGGGTVFKITPSGTLTTLHNFEGPEGAFPETGLVQGIDGKLYGTTGNGGNSNACIAGCGTFYSITPTGVLTPLYNFCSQNGCADGAGPNGLLQSADGNFYGTASGGGDLNCNAPGGCGTAFKITRSGQLTVLHTFELADGIGPSIPGLIQASDGNLYGTTVFGGPPRCASGPNGCGTIFAMTQAGVLTNLYVFCSQGHCLTDGFWPTGGLVQATTGIFYGITFLGGELYNDGTIFSLSTELSPFVAFVRSYGKVGQTGGILGQGFTGTTSVALNGIEANFTVKSDTYLTATVPGGATTGYVTVTTPSGTLQSNVQFRVIP